MDLKSDDYHTKIDPSGIDMSGNGNNIILDVTGGKVGIGTNNPSSILEIAQSFNAVNHKGMMLSFKNTYPGYWDWQLGPTISSGSAFQLLGGADGMANLSPFITVNGGTGNVGIGTAAPGALLQVGTDHVSNIQMIRVAAPLSTNYRPLQLGGWNTSPAWDAARIQCSSNLHIDPPDGGSTYLNLYEQGALYMHSTVNVTSDQRIKTNIETVDDNEALNIVNQLETKKYNYIDKTTEKKRIGFIAQEVKAILPDAVSLITLMVPNIYTTYNCIIEVISNNLYKINILEWPNGEENSTYKLIFNKGTSDKFSINGEYKNGCFELEITTEKFNINITTIFIYGKEVNDFHTIDKNQIFALHHSAIQELSRRNDTLVAENTAKTAEISELKNEISLIKQHLGI